MVFARAFVRVVSRFRTRAVSVLARTKVKWAVRVRARCAVVVEGGWKSGRRKQRPPRVWDILGLGF